MAAPAGIALAISVAIHVEASVPPELTAAAVRSCEAALGEGQCRLRPAASAREGASGADFHASLVSRDERLDAARVEIRKRDGGPVLTTRQVSFAPEDSPKERWASAGVLIAALAVAEARAEPPPPPPPPPEPRRPPPAPPKPRALAPAASLRVDLGALGARRHTRGPPELGVRLGASVLFGGGPWFTGLSFAGAHRPSVEPSVSWASVAPLLGLRAGRRDARLALEFSAGPVLEYWRIAAAEPGRSESAGQLRTGGTAGIDGLWSVRQSWILSLGVEGRFVAPRVRVDISGSEVESLPPLGVVVWAGVRFAP